MAIVDCSLDCIEHTVTLIFWNISVLFHHTWGKHKKNFLWIWKQPKYLPWDKWRKMWHAHTMKYYTALKRKESCYNIDEIFSFLFETGLACSPSLPGAHYVAQTGLDLRGVHLSLPPSLVLILTVRATMPSYAGRMDRHFLHGACQVSLVAGGTKSWTHWTFGGVPYLSFNRVIERERD